MLFAAIDIGSNAARLLFANAYDKDGIVKLDKASLIRIPTRLGEDVYNDGIISKEKAKSFIKTMKAFKLLIDVYQPIGYIACATAAMRESKNSEEILSKIKKETGLKIQIIEGRQEAEILRNTNRIIFPTPKHYALFMDVGGGSVELSIEREGKLLKQKSFKVGTLRMLNNKVKNKVWSDMKMWLEEYDSKFHDFHIVGTGGNINRLCKLYGNNDRQELNIGNLEFGYQQLKNMSIEDRISHYGFRPDRADVIVPAAYIYRFVMNTVKATSIFVPRKGLADGLILKQYKEYKRL
ncbi:exopolyphosphatase [Lentimicrobium sp. S6]|uniref:Ppx/GppA phosphatase family protein n=1 Tax=Lentimicrobium sp. S6 TaxID=2735872 RepID=UPI001556D6A2|nr:exopolyphosphatase [Lentimicrobium sp. S6]NPD44765.1 exopolyphosphatase [Lentimicrobium sp. S6]